ncbi:MAG: STM3941 family protein [Nonlabens sp.]|uniref:STM3941 family protein n=1 Tax=Nonlabens sp. TaxID=1888209 RepID=UPI003EF12B83
MYPEIIVPLNKVKIALIIVGSFLFVVGGYLMLWNVFGILSIIFFGASGIFGLIKLFDSKPGLVISSEGIIDNTSLMSAGLIKWKDIKHIRSQNIGSQRFFMIELFEPLKYVEQAGNGFKSLLMKISMKMYGTPVAISTIILKYNFYSLDKLLYDEHKKNKLSK